MAFALSSLRWVWAVLWAVLTFAVRQESRKEAIQEATIKDMAHAEEIHAKAAVARAGKPGDADAGLRARGKLRD